MKAIVVDIEKNAAYLLDETGTFHRVKREAIHAVGREIEFRAPVARKLHVSRRIVKRTILVAACFAVMVFGGAFAHFWDSPAFSMYVDINPSIKFEVNGFNHVISHQSLNADGEALLNASKPKGDVIGALSSVVETAIRENYVTSTGVAVTVVTENKEKYQPLMDMFDAAFPSGVISFIAITPEEEQLAYENGVTPVKYKRAQAAVERNKTLTLDVALRMHSERLAKLASGKEVYVSDEQ